jgi:peptidoglycan hydrolase CwlO-like protein
MERDNTKKALTYKVDELEISLAAAKCDLETSAVTLENERKLHRDALAAFAVERETHASTAKRLGDQNIALQASLNRATTASKKAENAVPAALATASENSAMVQQPAETSDIEAMCNDIAALRTAVDK